MAPTNPLSYPSTYNNIAITPNTTVSYISAGSSTLPTLLLLHGFPSSSNHFRNHIPLLSTTYHVLAPDLPGFGLTTFPPEYDFTFDNLALTISEFLTALTIGTYAMYIFDYGAPVGLRLALSNPSSIKALWADPSPHNYEIVRNGILTLEATVYQYTSGVPSDDLPLVNPAA